MPTYRSTAPNKVWVVSYPKRCLLIAVVMGVVVTTATAKNAVSMVVSGLHFRY